MPDAIGRLSLLEMRQQVWRWANTLTPGSVNPATGEEGPGATVSEMYTAQDVNMAINQAVTARYIDMAVNAENLFADEVYIDVEADIVEYGLPFDLAFLRGLWWRSINRAEDSNENPLFRDKWLFMQMENEGHRTWWNEAPTYRFYMNIIRLNERPRVDNPRGIQVRYIKWAQFLAYDDAVLELQFAPLVQQLVILDAAASLMSLKGGLVFQFLLAERMKWEERLTVAVRNMLSPPFVNFTATAQDAFRNYGGYRADFDWNFSWGLWNG